MSARERCKRDGFPVGQVIPLEPGQVRDDDVGQFGVSARGTSQQAPTLATPSDITRPSLCVEPAQERITETEEAWLNRARDIVVVALRTRFGVPMERATDAVNAAAQRVRKLLQSGVRVPYFTSVLMYVARFAHENLNRDTTTAPRSGF